MRDLGRRAFSGLIWAGAADAAGKVLVFFATLVLARLLVPSEFGLVAFALSIIYALDYVGDLGLGAALIYRADAEDPRVSSTAFWIGIGGSLVLFGISWVIAPLLADVGPGDEVVGAVPRARPAVPVRRARQGARVPAAARARLPTPCSAPSSPTG